MKEAVRVALYLRVSTGRQSVRSQLGQLREFCRRQQHWVIVHTYIDTASGDQRDRPSLELCLKDASRRTFDVLLFWSLDRLTREGALRALELLDRLHQYGVKYRSFTEHYLDATTSPFAEAIVALIAAIAKTERERIRERIRAGLERARKEGRRLGRRPIVVDAAKMASMIDRHIGYRSIARVFQVSPATVLRRVKEWKKKEKQKNVRMADRRDVRSRK